MLIAAMRDGESRAADELLPLVYEELRAIAARRLRQEQVGQTLQPTALVHEAYLKLLGPDGNTLSWSDRGHFLAAAAEAMRRILVDRARSRGTVRRGGDRKRVPLYEDALIDEPEPEEMLGLEEALVALEQHDQRLATIIKLRFFTGLSVEETAQAMQLGSATVKRDWAWARAWLIDRMHAPDAGRSAEELTEKKEDDKDRRP